MLRLVCPKCNRDSYTTSVESFGTCPYCRLVFSAKHGIEKREHERTKREFPFAFSYEGHALKACVMDFSTKGFGINIFGDHSISPGKILDIKIGDLQVVAKVMWVNNRSDESISMMGLSRLN